MNYSVVGQTILEEYSTVYRYESSRHQNAIFAFLIYIFLRFF